MTNSEHYLFGSAQAELPSSCLDQLSWLREQDESETPEKLKMIQITVLGKFETLYDEIAVEVPASSAPDQQAQVYVVAGEATSKDKPVPDAILRTIECTSSEDSYQEGEERLPLKRAY